jgi:hypothetical protein
MKVPSLFFVAGLAVAILAIAPAKAEKKNDRCSETGGLFLRASRALRSSPPATKSAR